MLFWRSNNGNGGDDDDALMTPLWVLCPGEEDERRGRGGEVKGI